MRLDEAELSSLMVAGSGWGPPQDGAATNQRATVDPAWVRAVILGAALSFMGLFVLLPLATVFIEALAQGLRVYLAAVSNPEARSAIRLTLLVASIAVPLNVIFGLAAAWAITRFDF